MNVTHWCVTRSVMLREPSVTAIYGEITLYDALARFTLMLTSTAEFANAYFYKIESVERVAQH
jgi:hypothetical protein